MAVPFRGAVLVASVTVVMAAACARGGQQPAPASPGIAAARQVQATAGAMFASQGYAYRLTVPPGWRADQRNPKNVALRLPEKGFVINVAVYEEGDLPPAPGTLEAYRDVWLGLMRDVMPRFTVTEEGAVTVGGYQALTYEYTWVDRGKELKARALLLRHPKWSYEVFGWVPPDTWPEFAAAIDEVIRSFVVE